MKALAAVIVVLIILPIAAADGTLSGGSNQADAGKATRRHDWAAPPLHLRHADRLQPPPNDDCARFDPAAAVIRQLDHRWRIVAGDHWLFDFGNDRLAAERALGVMRHYRLDRVCFVGRTDSAFVYLLARGGVPLGKMDGEDCLAVDPNRIRLSRSDGRWTIVAGGRRLLRLGRNASEARRALAAIRHHGFTHVCFVGPSTAGFTYWRR